MARYSRLKDDTDSTDTDYFEVADHFLQGGEGVVGDTADNGPPQKTMRDYIYKLPATRDVSSENKAESFNENRWCAPNLHAHQRPHPSPQQQGQNIENGNPNVGAPLPDHNNQATSGFPSATRPNSAGKMGGRAKLGATFGAVSLIGRASSDEQSGRWKASPGAGCAVFPGNDVDVSANCSTASTAVYVGEGAAIASSRASNPWAAAARLTRLPSVREATAGVQEHQQQRQTQQPSNPGDGANEPSQARVWESQKPLQNSAKIPILGGSEKTRTLAAVMHSMSPQGERDGPATPAPGVLGRSLSTRELKPRSEEPIETWRNQPAARSARQYGSSHRDAHQQRGVTFSVVENHELDEDERKQDERWREPAPHGKTAFSTRNNGHCGVFQPYNYEQPGFVDREKDGCSSGKAYIIDGVLSHSLKDCQKGSRSGRHGKLARAFSLRENHRSSYTRISRAFSVHGSGTNVLPVECVTCGQGMGIVVLGIAGNEASFCKSCRPASDSGGGGKRGSWPGDATGKKASKKGIVDYCRKLLRIPRKVT